MLIFDRAVLKKYWPADDKGDEDEIVRQVVMQMEAEVDNSMQIGELFTNMVRGLVKVVLADNLTGEEYEIKAATIKPFNVKQKKVKIGKGDDSDFVRTEFVAMNIVSRLDDERQGQMLTDLYRFFNIELQLRIEEFTIPAQASESENMDTDMDENEE
ncbi:hypothetical protein GF406_09225 [candidate division KSB1 bacterium]|nr:hypothetical protein [candidate division KSB1 bacterium]